MPSVLAIDDESKITELVPRAPAGFSVAMKVRCDVLDTRICRLRTTPRHDGIQTVRHAGSEIPTLSAVA
jgi:hypothetical protein